jgi:hypothetical protein
MSQLERLAEAVVQMGKQSGPAMETVDQSQRSAERLAVAVPNDSEGYSRTIRTHLYEAAAALREVARLLSDFDKQAEAFAKRLVGGIGDGPTSGGANLSRRAGASVEDIQGWLGNINPGYSPFSKRGSNCGNCALAVFKTLNGGAASDAGLGTLSTDQMEAATGRKQISMSPSEIETLLRAAGPGSHAVVGIDRASGPGHWFNAYYDGHDVWAVDGQTGTIKGWPPNYGSPSNPITLWDSSVK